MPENLAVIIYTSGSTGRPKGVMLQHRGLCNRLHWGKDFYGITDKDRLLQILSFSFDFSVWDVFTALSSGARLIMARPGGHQDSAYLVELIPEQNITVAGLIPSILEVLLTEPGMANCTCLKKVFSGGETLSVALQERFFARLGAELHNTYGPTESSIDVTSWVCRRDENQRSVPIGRPIANTQIYLLDKYLEPVPVGVSGELCIGGESLARGYLNHPALTAEKFIPHPFADKPGARLYKTGDLARYRQNGEIEFIGRMDNQVKLRGFRIELGEIETTLAVHHGVSEVAVTIVEGEKGEKRLIAYIVPYSERALTVSELRRYAKEKLPGYMVPSAFVMLEAMPRTANGKVNPRALPAPDRTRPELEEIFTSPRTPTEDTLASIWAEVLGLESVGIHDNFFELGGHSLLATQVISRVRATFQIEVPLRSMFETPTAAGLAEIIEQLLGREDRIISSAIVPLPREQYRAQLSAQGVPQVSTLLKERILRSNGNNSDAGAPRIEGRPDGKIV